MFFPQNPSNSPACFASMYSSMGIPAAAAVTRSPVLGGHIRTRTFAGYRFLGSATNIRRETIAVADQATWKSAVRTDSCGNSPLTGWRNSLESVETFRCDGWQLCRGIGYRIGLD